MFVFAIFVLTAIFSTMVTHIFGSLMIRLGCLVAFSCHTGVGTLTDGN
jgi:hypothetical protein